jgi:hypothetical protein
MLDVEDGDLVGGSRGKRTMKRDIGFLGISLLRVAGHLRAVRPGFILRHIINKKYFFTPKYLHIVHVVL